ncbi:unnamed protein product [Caenorhabditis brenneri]
MATPSPTPSGASDPVEEGFQGGGQEFPICPLCKNREATGFSYCTFCCNACKMFFRRTLQKEVITQDRSLERFEKCIQAGMNYIPTENLLDVKNKKYLSAFLTNLKYLEEHRQSQLRGCYYIGNPTVEEIAQLEGPIEFIKRPENFPMFLSDWVFITGMVSLNYLKQFTHAHLLNHSDRAHLLKHTFLDFSVFMDAMRVYQQKQDRTTVQPVLAGVPQEFLNGLRCRLAGRIEELKVTKEEFSLLSLVLFCNPALPNISDAGQVILNTYRQIYRHALLQHCLINYELDGPARLTDLLSIYHIIIQTRHDLLNLFTYKSDFFRAL